MIEIARVIARYPINHLVVINTYPLATTFVHGLPAIKPNNGIGGLGGAYLKPIALAHVVLFREYLPNVPIIAVGGVSKAGDVADFLKAGATAIQVGTAMQNHGIKILDELSAKF